MLTRTRVDTLTFAKPFSLKGIDRLLPAGDYRVSTDEELIEGLSFPVYRRVATMIFVPAQANRAASTEMFAIDPADLRVAQAQDSAPGGKDAADRAGT
jgi:hypothetical protein